MKTINVVIYSFAELSETAKKKAIKNEVQNNYFADYIFSDAGTTLKRFA